MKKNESQDRFNIIILLLLSFLLLINIFPVYAQENVLKDSCLLTKPLIVAHYMSWYQRPEISGSWGFWQVNRPTIHKEYWHFPEHLMNNKCRDISSVYYPVIGPYDSGDSDLCEYHILLAKLSGIDAFVADWYGPDPSSEHPYDNIGFTAMRKTAEKLDFKIMICWEDRSMFPMISPKVSDRSKALERGKEMISYLETEWFNSPAYLKIKNRPVLTNFAWGDPGNTIQEPWLNAKEWDTILSSTQPRPLFIHDWHRHSQINEFSHYESVMPWGDIYHNDADTVPAFWEMAEAAMKENGRFSFLSGVVLPGFDNRGCEGWGTDGAIGFTDRRNGEKYQATWNDNIKHDIRFIQITTWNDFNEGGTIEPARPLILHNNFPATGYGYRELETTAEYIGKLKGYEPDLNALRLPAQIYIIRKMLKQLELTRYPLPAGISVNSIQCNIDKAIDSLLKGNTTDSEVVLQQIFTILPDDILIDPDFDLEYAKTIK